MTALLPGTDELYAWMLGGPAPLPDLRLPPGGVSPEPVLAMLRELMKPVRAAHQPGDWLILDGDEVVGLIGLKAPADDEGKVEFGYDNAISNDVRTVNLTLRAETERTIGPDNLLFKGRFLYGANNGLATTDKEDGDGRWRHNLSRRVFLQTDTSYNSDKIQLVNYELQQNAGLGCTLYKDLRQTADVGAGATAQYLDATGIDRGFDYLGNFFQDYSFRINRLYKLMEDMTAQYSPETRGRYGFVPDLSVPLSGQARDYAYRFHTTLQGKINARMSLNLHYEYEFDNAILNPSDRTEQRITTTLGYGF